MARAPKVVVARAYVVVEVDGKPAVVVAGSRFRADDPLVKAYPEHFEVDRQEVGS